MPRAPTELPADIRLTLTEGPIIIPALDGAGIDATHPLWDCAVASESFPPGAGDLGANYVVTLKKGVSHANEVRRTEDDLTKALHMLAAAWPFAGGSYMTIETREIVCSSRFKSNAEAIEQQMLERCGLKAVGLTSSVPADWSATYSQPPLCLASRIALLMRTDFHTRKLLLYHQRSVVERDHPAASDGASWFISLYKVRDFLCKLYKGHKATKTALGISGTQWSDFGNLLNDNDLRHAEISGNAPSVSDEQIDKLYAAARCWVASYLRTKGLPAIG